MRIANVVVAALSWAALGGAEAPYASPDGDFQAVFPTEPTIAGFPYGEIRGPDQDDPAKSAALSAAVQALKARYQSATVFSAWSGARQFMIERMRPRPEPGQPPLTPSCAQSHTWVGPTTSCRMTVRDGRPVVEGAVRIGHSGTGSFRIMAAGGAFYVISYSYLGPYVARAMNDADGPTEAEAQRFFDSFHLTAPASGLRS